MSYRTLPVAPGHFVRRRFGHYRSQSENAHDRPGGSPGKDEKVFCWLGGALNTLYSGEVQAKILDVLKTSETQMRKHKAMMAS